MQINALQTRPANPGRGQGVATVDSAATRSTAPLAKREQVTAPVRGGLRSLDAQRNQNATAAQRTLAFIDAAQASLGALKRPLSDAVAGRMLSDEALQAPLRQFSALWQTRPQATGGGLDAQLRVVDAGQAQQRFNIRGLDAQSLGVAEREQLQFTVLGRQSYPVTLEPGLPLERTAKRLDQVLAPLGVRAELDPQGELQFHGAETDWPALRDSLQIKGGGRLFPTGQFNRVRTEATPESVQPQSWRMDDPFALRRSLHEIVQLSSRLEAAARNAGERLQALAGGTSAASDQVNAQQAQEFADGFRDLVGSASFAALREVAPATAGLSRERVQSLLNLA
ncbi:MAG TPA: hypothetical protein VLC92_21960 [Rhodocyclaceae bacterium]|nr:hypothetical protein [Rhodocyclaceae bacterium]